MSIPLPAPGISEPLEEEVNVLLIDDEERNLAVLVSVLEPLRYNLIKARTPRKALAALLAHEIAVIVLDIHMPELTGFELADLIKQRERTRHVPIIFLTAYFQDEKAAADAYGVGAVDFLTKPVDPRILRSKVSVFVDLLRASRALAASNRRLEAEVRQREEAEQALREANNALEARVEQRTAALTAHAARAEFLSKAASDLLVADAPERLRGHIFRRLAHAIRLEVFADFEPNPANDGLVCASYHGIAREGVEPLATAGVPPGFEQHAAGETDAPEQVSPVFARLAEDLGLRLAVRCPLRAADGFFGGVWFGSREKGALGEGEKRFIQTVCDLVAASIERARLLEKVKEARDIAERAGRAKDDFLAALSHELRTPLNPVLLLASEAAQDRQLPEEVRQDFITIRNNVELEARLIDDLLDITRITRGKLSLESAPLELIDVLNDAVATIRSEAESKRIELITDFEAASMRVDGDAVRLQQVFWNVLKNAVKFTPNDGRVSVHASTDAAPSVVVVNVTDTGYGMTEKEIDNVFDAFVQGEHAQAGGSHRFGGVGLGLAISRKLVELHGGHIRAQSAGRGEGASFTVELPLARHDAREGVKPDLPKGGKAFRASSPPASGPRRVLLVEDHAPTRATLTLLLERRSFEVSSAASVGDARACAAAEPFDLVITDIGLPDGSGYELMDHLRENHGLRGIALSGYGMESDIARAKASGFVLHLTKPVRVQALESALAQVFGASA
ncbi:MAG: hybrid sensor histidine kinase/response regulator [Opitutaceae bacterium]